MHYLLLPILLIVVGCVQPKTQPTTALKTMTEPKSQLINSKKPITDNSSLTLNGTLTASGTASGKTMAAWNGFDVGETVYLFKPGADQHLPVNVTSPVMLRAPKDMDLSDHLRRAVTITGTWRVPETVVEDINMVRQMPVSLEADGGSTIVQPEVTILLTTISKHD